MKAFFSAAPSSAFTYELYDRSRTEAEQEPHPLRRTLREQRSAAQISKSQGARQNPTDTKSPIEENLSKAGKENATKMPPKFNPPRPSTATPASAPKSKGRPKGSTNKPKPSPSGIKKSKSITTTNGQTKSANGKKGGERLSAASVRSLLPSLSPDTSEEISGFEEEGDIDIEIEIGNDSDDPFASQSQSQSRKRREAEDVHAAELDERKEKIPDDLLAVVLSRMWKQEGSRMSRDAVRAVGKYVDTFLREGVARAAWAGEERRRNGVLEVEDLEKLAPQLLLDF